MECQCNMQDPMNHYNLGMRALAMAYVPNQLWNKVYENPVALCRGTIFPCLDKPFLEGECPRE